MIYILFFLYNPLQVTFETGNLFFSTLIIFSVIYNILSIYHSSRRRFFNFFGGWCFFAQKIIQLSLIPFLSRDLTKLDQPKIKHSEKGLVLSHKPKLGQNMILIVLHNKKKMKKVELIHIYKSH